MLDLLKVLFVNAARVKNSATPLKLHWLLILRPKQDKFLYVRDRIQILLMSHRSGNGRGKGKSKRHGKSKPVA